MTTKPFAVDLADGPIRAAVVTLLVLTTVMLMALLTRTPPHPPLEVAPFALAPFFGASIALGIAALGLLRTYPRPAVILATFFALTALVSFGPHKYVDPAFSRIWPAVLTGQAAIAVVLFGALKTLRRGRP